MSRNFTLTTPTRRSKRLIENGYYRVPSTDVMEMLDVSASDEDDTTSIDSNISKMSYNSEQRKIVYKESPVRLFGIRRRQHSHSPIRRSTTSTLDLSVQHSRDGYATKTNQINHFLSQKNLPHVSNVSSIEKNNVVAGSFSDTTLTHSSSQNSHFMTNDISINQSRSVYKQKNNDINALYDEAGTGDNFKVPILKLRSSNSIRSQIKIQDQSTDNFLSDEDFQETLSTELTSNRKYFSTIVNFMRWCTSLIVEVVYKAGRLLYRIAILLLLFDTWFLSTTVRINHVFKRIIQFIIFVLLFLLLAFLFHFLLPDSTKSTKMFLDKVHSSPDHKTTAFTPNVENLQPFDDVHNSLEIKDLRELMQKLEWNLKKYERQTTERYFFLQNSIEKMQGNSEMTKSNAVAQEEWIKNIEMIFKNSIEMEILKSNQKFEKKIELLQLELALLHQNNSDNLKNLRYLNDKMDSNKNANEPYFARLIQVENEITNIESKLYALLKEHNILKASIDSQSGNLTYLRQIFNQQFIVNFQALMEESNGPISQQNIEKRRLSYLVRIFTSWVEKKGFVREDALVKLKKEVFANSTHAEKKFNKALEYKIDELKKSLYEKAALEPIADVTSSLNPATGITEDLIKTWIKEALDLYSADRVGEADFALESAGGSVVNTRCSETFKHKTALVSVLGIPIYYNINSPRSVIQPSVMPGECWAFQGTKGFIVISLSATIKPSGFTIDHIPKSLSLSDSISSAPKDFSVYGLKDASDINGSLLGMFRFEKDGEPVQRFTSDKSVDVNISYIELRINSNWGNPNFTCLYRFRVHGQSV